MLLWSRPSAVGCTAFRRNLPVNFRLKPVQQTFTSGLLPEFIEAACLCPRARIALADPHILLDPADRGIFHGNHRTEDASRGRLPVEPQCPEPPVDPPKPPGPLQAAF